MISISKFVTHSVKTLIINLVTFALESLLPPEVDDRHRVDVVDLGVHGEGDKAGVNFEAIFHLTRMKKCKNMGS